MQIYNLGLDYRLPFTTLSRLILVVGNTSSE